MYSPNSDTTDNSMEVAIQLMPTPRLCVICGAKSIGVNFGAPTCAPCKAFFRRNARRKELLESECPHRDEDFPREDDESEARKYSVIRRCSSCRLSRCYDMGMKEELVRTNEENVRHKQLVDSNRRRRALLQQKRRARQLSMPQYVMNNSGLLRESDWRHLSNIVSAYETHCLKTYLQQRSAVFSNRTSQQDEHLFLQHHTTLPMNLTMSLFGFLGSLPAARSLSYTNQTYLSKHNLRSLLFPNMFELSQLCFTEPWQASLEQSVWKWICGPELHKQMTYTTKLAERSLPTDPIITRLWMVILYFSSSLFCLYDSQCSYRIPKKKTAITEIQNAYAILLWNYLLYRYGDHGAVHIYSKLILVYINMQRTGFEIGVRVRTRNELLITYKTLNQVLVVDTRDSCK